MDIGGELLEEIVVERAFFDKVGVLCDLDKSEKFHEHLRSVRREVIFFRDYVRVISHMPKELKIPAKLRQNPRQIIHKCEEMAVKEMHSQKI